MDTYTCIFSKVFSERFSRAVKDAHISKVALAQELGLADRSLRRYELGDRFPTLDVAARLASALGVSLDYLAGLTDDPNPH